MKTVKQWTVTTMLACAMMMAAAPDATAQAPANSAGSSMTLPVVGSGPLGTFTGTFQLQRFVTRDGAVFASGILSGTVSNATGVVGTVARTVQLPVAIGETSHPVERLVINEEVCEGCGDCIVQSNCMSLTPVATAFGDKVRIHQSSCNKDYTCVLGDCPSFVRVTVTAGTGLSKRELPVLGDVAVPEPMRRG